MSLKNELSQLQKRYPILTKIALIIFFLLLIVSIYEIGKELGIVIYHFIH